MALLFLSCGGFETHEEMLATFATRVEVPVASFLLCFADEFRFVIWVVVKGSHWSGITSITLKSHSDKSLVPEQGVYV